MCTHCVDKCDNYIHDTYIGSTGWASTWNWLMGQIGHSGWTLVDVVAGVFSGVSGALTAIKSSITEFAAGVKAGLEYIALTALTAIINVISQSLAELIKAMMISLTSLIGFTGIQVIENGVEYNGQRLAISNDGPNILIELPNGNINLFDILIDTSLEVETLSVYDKMNGFVSTLPLWVSELTFWAAKMVCAVAAATAPEGVLPLKYIIPSIILSTFISFNLNYGYLNYDGLDPLPMTKEEYAQNLLDFHWYSMMGHLVSAGSKVLKKLFRDGLDSIIGRLFGNSATKIKNFVEFGDTIYKIGSTGVALASGLLDLGNMDNKDILVFIISASFSFIGEIADGVGVTPEGKDSSEFTIDLLFAATHIILWVLWTWLLQ
ncbi:MAG: hypothetical protein INQ03_24755 [Candidatus Heimdallarchaeota archaeon]|nr:hypothetical protein [Candidatus Heimdallarchaeota archaeon]